MECGGVGWDGVKWGELRQAGMGGGEEREVVRRGDGVGLSGWAEVVHVGVEVG